MIKIVAGRAVRFARVFFLLSLLSSCGEFLEEHPESQLNKDDAYNTVDKLEKNALLSVYNYIGGNTDSNGLQGTNRGVYDLNSMTTDEQLIPTRGGDWFDGGLWSRLFFHTWSAGEAPFKNTWDYLFKVVMMCNEGLEHIAAYETTSADDEYKLERYRGELRAVRAMYYFYLMDLYGRVPLVTSTQVKSSQLTLEKRSVLFHWIWNELSESLNYLNNELSQQVRSRYYGRVTVNVAYFLMTKLALNAEIYTDDNWTDRSYPDGLQIMLKTPNYYSGDIVELNAWETVKYIYSNLLSRYYTLADFYPDNFEVNNEDSKENIFTIPMNPLLYSNQYNYFYRSRHYCHGAVLGGSSENGTCATVSAMKVFGYDSDEPDMRMVFNCYYDRVLVNSEPVCEDDGTTVLEYQPMAVTDFDLTGTRYEKTAGARLAKYSVDATARNDGRMGNNDIVLFRFGDAMLMCAEACWRTGETGRALSLVNRIYRRSNGHEGYQELTEDVLLNERLMELMWEGWRRNDLIRFHRFHLPYDLKQDASHEADAHTTVFPIPADMIAMHPDWEQNPGY